MYSAHSPVTVLADNCFYDLCTHRVLVNKRVILNTPKHERTSPGSVLSLDTRGSGVASIMQRGKGFKYKLNYNFFLLFLLGLLLCRVYDLIKSFKNRFNDVCTKKNCI